MGRRGRLGSHRLPKLSGSLGISQDTDEQHLVAPDSNDDRRYLPPHDGTFLEISRRVPDSVALGPQ
jgi:hypothetical protein